MILPYFLQSDTRRYLIEKWLATPVQCKGPFFRDDLLVDGFCEVTNMQSLVHVESVECHSGKHISGGVPWKRLLIVPHSQFEANSWFPRQLQSQLLVGRELLQENLVPWPPPPTWGADYDPNCRELEYVSLVFRALGTILWSSNNLYLRCKNSALDCLEIECLKECIQSEYDNLQYTEIWNFKSVLSCSLLEKWIN